MLNGPSGDFDVATPIPAVSTPPQTERAK